MKIWDAKREKGKKPGGKDPEPPEDKPMESCNTGL